MNTEAQPISPLVAELISAQLSMTHDTTNRLIENLQATIADADAHRLAVEYEVERLLDGDFMPTPDAIRRAVFAPCADLVARFREEPSS